MTAADVEHVEHVLGMPQEEALAAAWAVLEAQAERLDAMPAARRALGRFAREHAVPADVLDRLVTSWVQGGALACVRALEGGAAAPGWFTTEQARELVTAWRDDPGSRVFARGVWRALVRMGWSPDKARLGAWGWSPARGTLPNGQWMPPELIAPPPDGASGEDDDAGLLHVLAERRRSGADDPSDARAALDDAMVDLMLDRPFHWALLDAAHVVEDERVPTMAVGVTTRGEIALFYRPDFVLGLGPEQRKGVLLHELHHVLFGHLVPPDEAQADPTAWTLACEVTANEYVPYALPEPVTLAELDLPLGESTLARFARLRRRRKLVPEWGARMRAAERDRIKRPLAPTPRAHDDVAVGPRDPRAALVAAASRVAGGLDRETRQMLAVPGLAVDDVVLPDGKPTLAWNELLRVLGRGLLVRRATRTYPSRRLPHLLGVAPGRRQRRERPVVMAVIDTSASMSSVELGQVSSELTRLVREHVRVACVQCDDEIRRREWLTVDAVVTRVQGRGGTDLRPPFAPAEQRLCRPDLVVYFTDGRGPAPEAASVPVLWVLTGNDARVPATFGRVVRMRGARGR